MQINSGFHSQSDSSSNEFQLKSRSWFLQRAWKIGEMHREEPSKYKRESTNTSIYKGLVGFEPGCIGKRRVLSSLLYLCFLQVIFAVNQTNGFIWLTGVCCRLNYYDFCLNHMWDLWLVTVSVDRYWLLIQYICITNICSYVSAAINTVAIKFQSSSRLKEVKIILMLAA